MSEGERSDSDVLAQRAACFREAILEAATGPGGMIVSFCQYDTRRPFQEGEEHHWYLSENLRRAWGDFTPRPTVAEWYYGENTLWVTGWFLYSQILRYRATGEDRALESARKCFRDLNNIFRLCREIEPGLLGKPHGGRAGPTTSNDQSASPVVFYAMYAQEMATPEEKAEAVGNMALHGDYYLRRNWVMNHHGRLVRIVDPTGVSAMKYLACVYAAYQVTGETRYRDAAFKYMREIIQAGRLPWPSNPYETNHNLFYWGLLCEFWSKTEIASEFDWIGCICEYWQAAQTALDEEGLIRLGHYDTVLRSFTPYPDRWLTSQDAAAFPQLGLKNREGRWWVSSTCVSNRMLNCAFSAALALLARCHGLDDNAHLAARRTLLRMDESSLRWWWDDGKLPDELKPLLNIFAPEVAAVWLVAYWMGRLQGVW